MRFVNSYQTQEERRAKYRLLRDKGADILTAQRCRDWTRGHIKRIMLPYLENAKATE